LGDIATTAKVTPFRYQKWLIEAKRFGLLHTLLPLPLQINEPHPVRLVAIAMGLATVPHAPDQARPIDPLYRSDHRAAVKAQKGCNPVQAGIALTGLSIKAVY
jgi:hypothetical protein